MYNSTTVTPILSIIKSFTDSYNVCAINRNYLKLTYTINVYFFIFLIQLFTCIKTESIDTCVSVSVCMYTTTTNITTTTTTVSVNVNM